MFCDILTSLAVALDLKLRESESEREEWRTFVFGTFRRVAVVTLR